MKTDLHSLCATLHGIPVEPTALNSELIYFIQNQQGEWQPTRGSLLNDIENICVKIHDALAAKIFGSITTYYEFLRVSPVFLATAGMNSESPLSKKDFETLLRKVDNCQSFNKALYLYDCRKLVSGIQECSKEVMQLQGEFYRSLNFDELFPIPDEPDGLRYVTSPITTKIHATLAFVYIRLHSLLDYTTKLAIECQHLDKDFTSYPRLTSKNSQYSERKRVSFNNTPGTLFEKCNLLNEIETVRNHVVHDGLIDDMPKVYKSISGGKCVEKFVLYPDLCDEARLSAFKNRNLFYSSEDKINLRLPHLVSSFQKRLVSTLETVLALLTPEKN